MTSRLVTLGIAGLLASTTLAIAAAPEQILLDQLSGEKVLSRGEYDSVRSTYASYFAEKYSDTLKRAFAEDHEAILTWLNNNPLIRDTLFTAIDPEVDQVEAALRLFREMYRISPEKLKDHANLAIAIAVTWDEPKAIYRYRDHQIRTRSSLPAEVETTDALENYQFYLSVDEELNGLVLQLPWEFLTHVVNHQTPKSERHWAIKNYLPRRATIGETYHEIAFDHEMVRTKSAVCKLHGSAYTLQNIQKFGGVCAMQADFAARVAKSLHVPAQFVAGESISGGLHAWVMWMDVKQIQADRVDFILMTEGRYELDQFAVGTILDPKSGQWITDRDLERRLCTLGYAPQASRHAALLMRAYPILRDGKKLSLSRQQRFLEAVLALFPYSERAWYELSTLYTEGKLRDPDAAIRLAERCLKTFIRFPDFSKKLLPDLLTPVKDKRSRVKLFEKAVLGYESLGRPDLACETRLELADWQVGVKEHKKAAEGLAQTIRKFPAEGRYVPKLMTRLEMACGQFPGGHDQLTRFYLNLLPSIPARRGDAVSDYWVKMHEQAIDYFNKHDRFREAELVEQSLRTHRGD